MEEHQPSELMASYHRCRRNDHFIDSFYEIFMAKSPAIAERFAHTDFKIQRLMLRESLLEMLCFDQEMSGSYEEILKLGRRHRDFQGTDDMYEAWLDSLCEAVRQYDPIYTPELEALWRQAMQKGIDVMRSVKA